MFQLVLVRHGESELNAANRQARIFCGQWDTPLTDEGRLQAREAGMRLAGRSAVRIRRAISSALARARETLALMVEHLPPPVRMLPAHADLNERSLGLFEGRAEADVLRDFPLYRDDEHFNRFRDDFIQKAPGGENLTEVTSRAWNVIARLLRESADPLLVVSHSMTIRCIVAKALGLGQDAVLSMRIPNAEPLILQSMDGNDFQRIETGE